MADMESCPFCGNLEISTTVVGEVFIDIYPDEEAEQTAKAFQVTAVCQCNECYGRAEDWARLLVPHVLYADVDTLGYRRGEYLKFVAEAHDKAKEVARIAWNRRAYSANAV